MITRFIVDFKKYWEYASYAAKAELTTEISGTYLSWLWWVLEPLCFMVVYVFVFGYVFQSQTEYFAIFIFLGITIWNFFAANISSSVELVYNNKHILGKVYLPKYMLLIRKILVNTFKMFISFILIALMLWFFKVPLSIHIFSAFPLLLLLFVCTFGFTMITLHLGVFIRDLANLVQVFLRAMFFLTGIFFSIEERIGSLSADLAYVFQYFNPFAFIISSFRDVVIYSKGLDWNWYFSWLGMSMFIVMLGLYLIYNNEDDYIKVL
ncbi:ABC transporter permease [Pasteurella atlantica]|uniref:ABC transporter permease n=3 Tax=Pasteurellaceae TaxID=712 RepID=A0ACC6HN60_9PAST|nr:ABC transporter permease [Pasteurella atlantica]MDP8052300.1 ABC transporter permease [Pasteurella atlantica]MDP8105790.1 ABC transporter permease [Pasteurella atlantica]MDP8149145.1 ABC transporter permease [Pasteurella atlantica]